MQTFVVLIRGVNVGSTRKLPMAQLRALCLGLGLGRPQTYIQSGNLIVEGEADAEGLRRLLESELTARFGFAVELVVRRARDWEGLVASSPFAGDAGALPRALHVYLSRDALEPGVLEALAPRAGGGERIRTAAGALWIDFGAGGVHASRLTPRVIDAACGSPTTGRNWNSVLKIHEMIETRGHRRPEGGVSV
jgi:uncharacterized protein (DUF1697 family)